MFYQRNRIYKKNQVEILELKIIEYEINSMGEILF